MAAVTFWQLVEDDHDFIAYLGKSADVVSVSAKAYSAAGDIRVSDVTERVGVKTARTVFTGLRQHVQAMLVNESETRCDFINSRVLKTLFSVSATRSCVISYIRPVIDDGYALSQSNVYCQWK